MDIQIFVISATVVMGFLGLIWKRGNWTNAFIKFTLLCMTCYGVGIILKHYYL